jgi:hypothetical protein
VSQSSNASASPGLVSVGNYPDTLSAESVRSCLEMEGIDAYVFDGEISRMQGWNTNAYGGVKVMVAKSDKDRALELLAQSELDESSEVVSAEEEIDPEGVHCPYCHSLRQRTRECWNLPVDPLQRFLTRMFRKTLVSYCPDCGMAKRS